MIHKVSKSEIRKKKHARLRNRISGTAEKPRLCVFRSNNHMYAQIIDDTVGNTICSASTLDKAAKELVGQYAAEIRMKRPPEPYKGKGIKYDNEHIIRKAGKTGKK